MPELKSRFMVAKDYRAGRSEGPVLPVNGKPAWRIETKRGDLLGHIEWNSHWKLYEFVPAAMTGYSKDCERSLADFQEEAEREATG